MDCGVFLSIRAPPLSEGGETLQSVEGVKIEEKALREEALRSATGKVGGVRREQGTRAT